METTCNYYKKTLDASGDTIFIPFADSRRDMKRRLAAGETFCPDCRAVVDYENKLDATGLIDICPFCHTELR